MSPILTLFFCVWICCVRSFRLNLSYKTRSLVVYSSGFIGGSCRSPLRESSKDWKMAGQKNEDGGPKTILTAIGSSAKFVVSGSAGLLVLATNSNWLPLYYILGGVVNAILSKLLKNTLRIPRPYTSKKGGYGMPSSHAQALFYFFSVIAGVLLRGAVIGAIELILVSLMGIYAFLARYELCFITIVMPSLNQHLLSSWRVTSGLHTTSQTVVGAILGFSFGQYLCYRERSLVAPFSDQPVPLVLRLLVISVGGMVLYFRELKAATKKKR